MKYEFLKHCIMWVCIFFTTWFVFEPSEFAGNLVWSMFMAVCFVSFAHLDRLKRKEEALKDLSREMKNTLYAINKIAEDK